MIRHTPVLLKEVIQYLDPKENQDFIDATLGFAGHSMEIVKYNMPKGRILGIEWDQNIIDDLDINNLKSSYRIQLVRGNYKSIKKIAELEGFDKVSGILFDLGLNSAQIDNNKNGISFSKDSNLDMKFEDSKFALDAKEIINKYSFKKLSDMFYNLADLGNSKYLAKKIIESRNKQPINTTGELVKVLEYNNPKILAKIFQALRIEVNKELENLILALNDSLELLLPGGRLIVISYHSGEDRIVKNFLRGNKDIIQTITKKPITPDLSEIKNNKRSRSAKMRVGQKI